MALIARQHGNLEAYREMAGRLTGRAYRWWNRLTDDEQEAIVEAAGNHANQLVQHINQYATQGYEAVIEHMPQWDGDTSNMEYFAQMARDSRAGQEAYERGASQSKRPRIEQAPTPTMAGGTIAAQEATENADQSAPGIEGALEPIHHVWRRFPNVDTAMLKWIYTQMIGGNSANLAIRPSGSAWDQQRKRDIAVADTYANAQASLDTTAVSSILNPPMLIQYRMTSPYNIVKSDSGNLSEPQWIGFFDSKYQYYHVAKAKWTLSFTLGFNDVAGGSGVPLGEDHQQYYAFYVYWKYTSEDDPPTSFAIDTTGKTSYNGSPLNCTPDDYDRMGGWNKIWIQGDNRRLTRKVITGQYETGQCRMDVKMINDPKHSGTATAEGWTAVKSTVLFPENLSVILVQDHAFTNNLTAANVNIGIRSEIDYLVQFRDLQSKYKYPVQSAAIGGTFDDGQYFYRGAAQLHPATIAATATEGTYN